MFERLREAKTLLHLLEASAPKYVPLVREDVRHFRVEVVKAAVGAGMAGAAALIFSCFLSVAVIISAWAGAHRGAVAWGGCGVWGAVGLVGITVLLGVLSRPAPFMLVPRQAVADYDN